MKVNEGDGEGEGYTKRVRESVSERDEGRERSNESQV